MQTVLSTTEQFITVIPKCSVTGLLTEGIIVIKKLCFWFNEAIEHPINETTIMFFLNHVKLYGASIDPTKPDKGCWAFDKEQEYTNSETKVGQIYYQGQLIYSE